MSLARRSSKPILGLLRQQLNAGAALPAATSGSLPAVSFHSSPSRPSASVGGLNGLSSLAGGAFVLSHRIATPSDGRRGISSGRPALCNLLEGQADCERPFGNPPGEEDEDDSVALAVGAPAPAAPVRRSGILFGGSMAAQATQRAARKLPQKAQWIGSVRHSGDYTRASLKKPVAEPTVWSQIISACKEDESGETLNNTVAMLSAASQQHNMVPPLPAFNKLLELCSKSRESMDTVHQLVDIMSTARMESNEETQKHLDACFAYNNRERAS